MTMSRVSRVQRFLGVLFLLATALSAQSPLQPSKGGSREQSEVPLASALQRIRSITVQVTAEIGYSSAGNPIRRGSKSVVLGSGFLVDTAHHVVTARHVVEAAEKARENLLNAPAGREGPIDPQSVSVGLFVGFASEQVVDWERENFSLGNFTMVPATFLKFNPTADVAVLQILEVPQHSGFSLQGREHRISQPVLPRFDERLAEEGEAIGVSGFPLEVPSLVTTFGRIGARYALANNALVQLGSVQVNPGNSGGPVYRLQDGAVIGIAIGYWQAPAQVLVPLPSGQTVAGSAPMNSGLAAITPIRYALELLSQ